MKTALILFKSENCPFPAEYIKGVSDTLFSGGIDVDCVEILPAGDDVGFKKRFSYLKDTADNIIILSGKETFGIKVIIAEELGTELIENENALGIAGISENEDEKGFAFMPIDATVIPNPDGNMQGFLTENGDFSLVFLPERYEEFLSTCENYLIPYFNAKYGVKRDTFTFKYFGDTETLDKTINEATSLVAAKSFIKTDNGDSLVKIVFDNGEKSELAAAKRYIVEKIGGRIYAEFDVSLGERLFDVLKLKNLKLSTAESFTGGRVLGEIIKNSGASAYVDEGIICYSNDSKKERLGVKESDLISFGAVSSKVAYRMAAGLLVKGKCDVAISTTGIAGPNSDNTLKPVGLNYIGIGMKDGIHVFKYELKGTREEITETAKNTALFLAIKKLKNI